MYYVISVNGGNYKLLTKKYNLNGAKIVALENLDHKINFATWIYSNGVIICEFWKG